MAEQLPDLGREMMGPAYAELVERRARQAWEAGSGDEFLTMVLDVCAERRVYLLSDELVNRLARAFDNPRRQYLVRVDLAAAALWEAGGWATLLKALGDTTYAKRPAAPTRTTPAHRFTHPPAHRRSRYPPRR